MRFLCGCYGTRGWLLRCCYAVARVLGWLLGYPRWLPSVAMRLLWYPGVVARVFARVPRVLLRCCYAVAKVPGVVARGLLCGFYVVAMVPGVVAKVLLCSC